MTEQTFVLRSRVLSNSAAEFVETRAGPAIANQMIRANGQAEDMAPEFVSELDKFLPKEDIPDDANIYKYSTEQLERFQDILNNFCETLKRQKVDKKLGIELKDPTDYTFSDVLSIARELYDKKEGPQNTKSCMGTIRRCFRAAERHEGALKTLLSFVPSDAYGSMICGGFTLVMTGIVAHQKLRNEIQAALADIPQKLSNVHRLTDLHMKSWPLKTCAHSVLLAIFVVLEKIVEKLSMNVSENLTAKLKGRGSDLEDALTSLDENINRFQIKVEVCAQQRLGRIETNGNSMNTALASFKKSLQEISSSQEEVKKTIENQLKFLAGRAQNPQEKLQAEVWNMMYRFFASDPAFNAIDGKANQDVVSQKEIKSSSRSLLDRNQELVSKWQKALPDSNHDCASYIAEYLKHLAGSSLALRDKVLFIMQSNELYEWLAQTQSCTLEIAADTPPEDLMNPISTVTALLSKTTSHSQKHPVLSFFCGLKTNDTREEEVSGTLGILRSLNAQLLEFILHNRQAIDLEFLADRKYAQTTKQKKKSAWLLFTHLLQLLPDSDVVFILVDSFSRVSGSDEDGEKLLSRIIGLEEVAKSLIFKVLVTDLLPNSAISKLEHMTLRVPDNVDGGQFGLDVELLQQENAVTFQRLLEEQKDVEKESSSYESSEEDW
ncbi:hypothetical protein GLAREA_11342 [Glarea lozoyensis ATCC 20868]|uniref:Uncharacterized protein n=1 Tax=Glarea lozoyensis (strain ATCC 20868 / MF5171) TaxID=1116229 RepID=S3DAZ2_GLAL2|nr:uncharacterized protein GLAREA_11342 [Glarea lozoyensis ATCC 20868]EPE35642.1 hypothetical protein GLAREA_11342 [Glarea lozoyensis ATCC 20868]